MWLGCRPPEPLAGPALSGEQTNSTRERGQPCRLHTGPSATSPRSVAVVAVVALVATACINNGTWTRTRRPTPPTTRRSSAVSCCRFVHLLHLLHGRGRRRAQRHRPRPRRAHRPDLGRHALDRPGLAAPRARRIGPVAGQCLSPTSCFVRYGYWGNGDHRDRLAHWNGSTFARRRGRPLLSAVDRRLRRSRLLPLRRHHYARRLGRRHLHRSSGRHRIDCRRDTCLSSTWC